MSEERTGFAEQLKAARKGGTADLLEAYRNYLRFLAWDGIGERFRSKHFRDGRDRTRRIGPLMRPKGAIPIETTRRTAHQVVQLMRRHIDRRTRA